MVKLLIFTVQTAFHLHIIYIASGALMRGNLEIITKNVFFATFFYYSSNYSTILNYFLRIIWFLKVQEVTKHTQKQEKSEIQKAMLLLHHRRFQNIKIGHKSIHFNDFISTHTFSMKSIKYFYYELNYVWIQCASWKLNISW